MAPTIEDSPSIVQKVVAEFLGTYILVFAGSDSALVDKVQPFTIVGIGLVWGLVFAAIYALGHISGAHFNPAVTIAFAAIRKLPWIHVPLYILSQLVGSTFASLTLKGLYNRRNTESALEDIPITGASMNPARSIGPAIVSGKYKSLWIYITAPVLGTTVAATLYCFLRPTKQKQLEKDDGKSINDVYSHSEP